MMNIQSKIYIAGHNGMVGSAILRKLKKEGYTNFVCKSSKELDLRNQQAVLDFFEKEKPEFVFLAAAKVGGIQANNIYRADFIYDNLQIENNVIYAAYKYEVKKLLFLGSSCIYPKDCPQPIKEEYLLSGPLEKTNEPYALAKIAGLKLCESFHLQYGCNFISLMPTNMYGPKDNYDLNNSHVLPALIRKIHEAKTNQKNEVEIWGTGKPKREFLHTQDLADACFYFMQHHNTPDIINIGTGEDLSIQELAELIARIIGFEGILVFNTSKPDGTMRKVLDISKAKKLGWSPKISLEEGIKMTYQNFLKEVLEKVS